MRLLKRVHHANELAMAVVGQSMVRGRDIPAFVYVRLAPACGWLCCIWT